MRPDGGSWCSLLRFGRGRRRVPARHRRPRPRRHRHPAEAVPAADWVSTSTWSTASGWPVLRRRPRARRPARRRGPPDGATVQDVIEPTAVERSITLSADRHQRRRIAAGGASCPSRHRHRLGGPAEAGRWVIDAAARASPRGATRARSWWPASTSRGGNVPHPLRVLRFARRFPWRVGADVVGPDGSVAGGVSPTTPATSPWPGWLPGSTARASITPASARASSSGEGAAPGVRPSGVDQVDPGRRRVQLLKVLPFAGRRHHPPRVHGPQLGHRRPPLPTTRPRASWSTRRTDLPADAQRPPSSAPSPATTTDDRPAQHRDVLPRRHRRSALRGRRRAPPSTSSGPSAARSSRSTPPPTPSGRRDAQGLGGGRYRVRGLPAADLTKPTAEVLPPRAQESGSWRWS